MEDYLKGIRIVNISTKTSQTARSAQADLCQYFFLSVIFWHFKRQFFHINQLIVGDDDDDNDDDDNNMDP